MPEGRDQKLVRHLRAAVSKLVEAESALGDACEGLADEDPDKGETGLLREEATDVRVRVKALADRLT